MTGKKLLNGYLDRLRENVATLDEALALARKMGKSKKAGDRHAAIQALKLIRDLAEVRNATLLSIKAHILGRDETGAVKEPANFYSGNAEVMFEREFRRLLQPWTLEDLKLECEDCGVTSEKVWTWTLETGEFTSENADLCGKCYEKRAAQQPSQKDDSAESNTISPDMEVDLSTPEKCQEMIQKVRASEAAGQLEPARAKAMIELVQNTLRLFDKQDDVMSKGAPVMRVLS